MPDDDVSQNNILIISENSSQLSELSQQLSGNGYQCINAPPFADFKYVDRRHPALIVILDCPDTCVAIAEHLRLNSAMPDIPIMCLCGRVSPGKPSDVEHIFIGEFLPKTSAFDALKYRIRSCPHEQTLKTKILSGSLSHERRYFERRQLMNLTEQTQAAHHESGIANTCLGDVSPGGQENNDSINLLVISQREQLFGNLLAHFSETSDIIITKECFNKPELIPGRLEQLHPDLLLVDTALSGPAVTEWLRSIRNKDAKIRIILLYDDAIPDLINEIVEFGISGLIKIDASRDVYQKAIRTVHSGELWLPHVLISQIITNFSSQSSSRSNHTVIDLPEIISTSALTQRELRVIELVAQGLTNKQIAKQLIISPETVKKKLSNIFDKSGVRSRSQLVSLYADSLMDRSAQKQRNE